MAVLAGLTPLLKAASIASTAVSTIGAIQSGNAQQAAMEHNAALQEQNGNQAFARSQRAAEEERRQARLMQSRAQAVGAASGGGRDYEIEADIEEEGELRALTRLYEGREAQRSGQQQAAASRFEGAQMARAARFRGAGSAISGGLSFYQKYGLRNG